MTKKTNSLRVPTKKQSLELQEVNSPPTQESAQAIFNWTCIFVCVVAFLTDFLSSITLILLLFPTVIIWIFSFFAALPRMTLRSVFAAVSTVAIVVSLFNSHWALKSRFWISNASLQAVVDETVANGEPPQAGVYGLFWLSRIRFFPKSSNAVAFDESRSTGSFDGVVYAPGGRPPGRLNYGNTYIELSENWYYVHGD